MSAKNVLFILLCAQAAWAAIHNATGPHGRTFLRRQPTRQQLVPVDPHATDEPFPDPDAELEEEALLVAAAVDPRTNGSKGQSVGTSRTARVNPIGSNGSKRADADGEDLPTMSDEARRFLSGPLSTVFMPCFYALVCLVSVPLNAVAVAAFARRIRPAKPAVVYMLNLATADLLLAALLPFRIAYHFNGNDWPFGPAMCRLVTAAFYCNMYCSVLLITCIAVDRLLAVVYPIDSLVWRRPQNAVAACVLMWILALGGSVPLVVNQQTMRIEEMDITTCHDVQDDDDKLRTFYMIYFSVLCCCLFFLPLVVTTVCYTRVIWTLSRIPPGVTGRSRRKARAVVMALTVLALFVACFAPSNAALLAHYLQMASGGAGAPDGSYAVYLVFMCVGSASCCLDPLVYYFGSSQCQRQLAAALGCRPPSSGSDSSQSTSSRTIFKSSLKSSSKKKADSADSAGLKSQYKKLLV